MNMKKIEILKEQINEIDNLKNQPAYGPKYEIWKITTLKLIEELFDESYVELFKRSGQIRLARGPEDVFQSYVEDLDKKKELLEGFLSEAERFKETLEVDVGRLTALENYNFHPKIKEVSQGLFEDKHYAQAVEEAFKKVIKEVKITVRNISGKVYDGDSLMNQAFGCDKKVPIIQFNNLSLKEEIDEQKGLMYLYKGIVGIRNRKAHDNVLLDDPNRAIEYLALASLLIRLLEKDTDIDAIWKEASYLHDNKRFLESIKAYERLIKIDASSGKAKEAQKMIGINYSNLKDHKKAEEAIEKAIQMGNTFPSTYFYYGNELCENGKYDKALNAFEMSLSQPDSEDWIKERAEEKIKFCKNKLSRLS